MSLPARPGPAAVSPSPSIRRRHFLTSLLGAGASVLAARIGVGAGVLLGDVAAAGAMGGTLPELELPAPDFQLEGVEPDPAGGTVEVRRSLEDFRGRWLVLYFYPRDFTAGCTLEARGFQRDLSEYGARNAVVVGISADDADSHASFCGSEGLAYPLLSDPGGAVSRRYGSWIAPFSQRHTFLIDPGGILRARWTAVRPAGHSREILAELDRRQGSEGPPPSPPHS